MYSIIFQTLMALNALWFTMGFISFSFRSQRFATLISPVDTQEPTLSRLAHSLKFLGGLNLALAVLALACLIKMSPSSDSYRIVALTLGVAHGSQFYTNLQVVRRKEKLWPVLSGTMLFIFVVDGLLAIINFVLAAI